MVMNKDESFDRTASHMAGEYVSNTEPVAWMQVHYKDNKPTKFSKVQTWEDDIPLYTHPVKEELDTRSYLLGRYDSTKTLTDEEIQEVAHGFGAIGWMGDTTYEFARAILRKAQEK